MASESPLAPLLLKGAFIRLDETAIGAAAQIIVFQYNPESLTRKFKPYEKPANDKAGEVPDPSARAAPYDPEEEMDIVISSMRLTIWNSPNDIRSPWSPASLIAWRRWRC